jgi:hypothetical protein
MIKKSELSEYFAKVGKKGGAATGKNRTAKERAEHARKAARARWAKKGKKR